MSGHSHWAGIKHKKGLADAQRSANFSKLAREIAIEAKTGDNPETNSKLKAVIEKARGFNMPRENIERAILRGAGKLPGAALECFSIEAYGPGGTAIIAEGITDNKNRSLSETRNILNKNNGKIVNEGAIRWMFDNKGYIVIDIDSQSPEKSSKEDLEMAAIEAGAENTSWDENILEVFTKMEELDQVKKNIESAGIKIEESSLGWFAKEEVAVDEKAMAANQKLLEELEASDDVSKTFSNLKF
ncbi:MAG: YebC/PmpR family DNA-binding transcriptional regulator [Candidatus Paceibacterota bacterium]|jgi:YebC/PmpR family DNA-binding regulatory protein|nr:YebC/PmpR family DNA-binding transcriptional regulator [Candidatus Paceibacterota bacterium]MDD4830835.1 YebC/PmpR family DNA-binding transcriptional regulator [Candidatus Paceibacterota bacterium]MDD4874916.1 YebC/PmpR family DNA-binding transcriptional regulator [Candidatus Paceibacterota bacterium]